MKEAETKKLNIDVCKGSVKLIYEKINEIQKYWKKCIQDLINPASEKLQFVQTEIQRTVHRWNQLFIKPKDCKSDSCKDEVSTKYLIRSRPGCFA